MFVEFKDLYKRSTFIDPDAVIAIAKYNLKKDLIPEGETRKEFTIIFTLNERFVVTEELEDALQMITDATLDGHGDSCSCDVDDDD